MAIWIYYNTQLWEPCFTGNSGVQYCQASRDSSDILQFCSHLPGGSAAVWLALHHTGWRTQDQKPRCTGHRSLQTGTHIHLLKAMGVLVLWMVESFYISERLLRVQMLIFMWYSSVVKVGIQICILLFVYQIGNRMD